MEVAVERGIPAPLGLALWAVNYLVVRREESPTAAAE
jgi:hypothetical protein